MADKTTNGAAATVAGLEAERAALAGKLDQVERELKKQNPRRGADLEKIGGLAAQRGALEQALCEVAGDLDVARQAAASEARQAADELRAAALEAATISAEGALKRLVALLPTIDAAAGDVFAAQRQLRAAGGWVAPVYDVAAALALATEGIRLKLRRIAPELLGLPKPDPVAVVALREARAAVKRGEELVAMAKDAGDWRTPGPVDYQQDGLRHARAWLAECERRAQA